MEWQSLIFYWLPSFFPPFPEARTPVLQLVAVWDVVDSFPFGGGTLLNLLFLLPVFTKELVYLGDFASVVFCGHQMFGGFGVE